MLAVASRPVKAFQLTSSTFRVVLLASASNRYLPPLSVSSFQCKYSYCNQASSVRDLRRRKAILFENRFFERLSNRSLPCCARLSTTTAPTTSVRLLDYS